MNQEINNGGSAFPLIPPPHESGVGSANGYPFPENGMSLRDWFAGQAIGAVIRQCAGDQAVSLDSRTPEQYFADKAFGIADAMLSAREAAR